MPKSKRDKVVHLTQVKKKGKDHKEDLMKQIEQHLAQFKRLFIFNFEATKSDRIMNLRLRLKSDGRIFAGRNSLVTATLRSVGSKTNTDFDDLSKQVAGHRGLLFSDMKLVDLIEVLEKEQPEFKDKLLGYAEIAPTVIEMETEPADAIELAKTKKKRPTMKKTRKKKEADKREIKFVKL